MSATRGDADRDRLVSPAEGAPEASEPLRLAFARGTAPGKWARRWAEAWPSLPLELVPLALSGAPDADAPRPDALLERVAPGARPPGTEGAGASRHAVRLYTESVALVVAIDHELAEQQTADREALELLTLLAHPDHAAAWPAPEPWADPAWAPRDAGATLKLVATGLGAALLPLPLARHLANKREHAVLPVACDPALPGTEIWVSWAVERDAADVQRLVGIMRGRTARSERSAVSAAEGDDDDPRPAPEPRKQASAPPQRGKQPQPPKNSRGAQLAAARAKRESQKRRGRKGSR